MKDKLELDDLMPMLDPEKKESAVIKNQVFDDEEESSAEALFSEEFSSDDVVDDFKTGDQDKEFPPLSETGTQNGEFVPDTTNFDMESLENYDEELRKEERFDDMGRKHGLKNVDLDSIMNYDDEKRKSNAFQKTFENPEDTMSEDEILEKNFKDFLVYRRVSGRNTEYPHSARIPSQQIDNSEASVEIKDDLDLKEVSDKHNSNVIVYKNDVGDVEYIEVVCRCGQKTIIQMKYDDRDSSLIDDSDTSHFVLVQESSEIPDEQTVDVPEEELDSAIIPAELLKDFADDDTNKQSSAENIGGDNENADEADSLFNQLEELTGNSDD